MLFSDRPRTLYRNRPAHEVICQLRFPSILSINQMEPAEFQEDIRDAFPQYARRQDLPPIVGGQTPPPPVTNYHFLSVEAELNEGFHCALYALLSWLGGICPPLGPAPGLFHPALQASLFSAGWPAVCQYLLPHQAWSGGNPLARAVYPGLHGSSPG